MRYKSYILFLSGLLLAGCSVEGVPGTDGRDDRIPVEIGVQTQGETKADVTSMEGLQFGLLALDPSRAPWSQAEDVLIPSSPAQVTGGSVRFIGAQNQYYYPVNADANYTFYAFRHKEMRVDEDPSAFLAVNDGETFQISGIRVGHQDILWAKSEATPLPDPSDESVTFPGYNAGYAMMAKTWYGSSPEVFALYRPFLRFRHLTSSVRFAFVAASEAAAQEMASAVFLTNLSLEGVHGSATLDVLEGTLSPEGDAVTITLDGEPVEPGWNGGEGNVFGEEALYVLPSDAIKLNFRIAAGGTGYSPVHPVEVSAGDALLPGHDYLFKIKVSSAKDIALELIDETDLREGLIFHFEELTENGDSRTISDTI